MSRYLSILFFFIASLFPASILCAFEYSHQVGSAFAYYLDDHKGGTPGSSRFQAPSYVIKKSDDNPVWTGGPHGWPSSDPRTRNLGSGWGSLEWEIYYRFQAITPFLQGSGALTKDNTLAFIVKPLLSPVSFHVENELQWTPVAFLKLLGGLAFGTGWYFPGLGLHGLALNNQDDPPANDGGIAGLFFVGATLQFDLAALMPGEYRHIVISLTSKIRYKGYNKAKPLDAWIWRADSGQNFNGWEYEGEYILGWSPPWELNFLGFIAEHKFVMSSAIRKRSMVAAGGWGSDFPSWRFGPLINIQFKENHNLTILLQLHNGLYFTEETSYARWFENWETTGNSYVKFERLALSYTWDL